VQTLVQAVPPPGVSGVTVSGIGRKIAEPHGGLPSTNRSGANFSGFTGGVADRSAAK